MNSKNSEDWEKNFGVLNETLTKIKSFKTIDPVKLSKCKFAPNFEFLQFVFDFIMKNFGETGNLKYQAYERRVEVAKSQFGNKVSDIKKYLPTHLIPNDLILKMDKQKFFPDKSTEDLGNNSSSLASSQNSLPPHLVTIIDKYKDFFSILKDDLRKIMDKNLSMSQEVNDIEEERQYYLEKINTVLMHCQKKLDSGKLTPEAASMLENIVKIITHVPEDFK